MADAEPCPVCAKGTLRALRVVDGVPYLRCDGCTSRRMTVPLRAEPSGLRRLSRNA